MVWIAGDAVGPESLPVRVHSSEELIQAVNSAPDNYSLGAEDMISSAEAIRGDCTDDRSTNKTGRVEPEPEPLQSV